jgi:hypothetical protein
MADLTQELIVLALLRRCVTAVTICAGAKGLATRTLFGTPFDGQSPAAAPDHRQHPVQLAGSFRDVPAGQAASREVDVGHEGDKGGLLALQELDGFICAGARRDGEAGLFEHIPNDLL